MWNDSEPTLSTHCKFNSQDAVSISFSFPLSSSHRLHSQDQHRRHNNMKLTITLLLDPASLPSILSIFHSCSCPLVQHRLGSCRHPTVVRSTVAPIFTLLTLTFLSLHHLTTCPYIFSDSFQHCRHRTQHRCHCLLPTNDADTTVSSLLHRLLAFALTDMFSQYLTIVTSLTRYHSYKKQASCFCGVRDSQLLVISRLVPILSSCSSSPCDPSS